MDDAAPPPSRKRRFINVLFFDIAKTTRDHDRLMVAPNTLAGRNFKRSKIPT
jgi:hypothetical protein